MALDKAVFSRAGCSFKKFDADCVATVLTASSNSFHEFKAQETKSFFWGIADGKRNSHTKGGLDLFCDTFLLICGPFNYRFVCHSNTCMAQAFQPAPPSIPMWPRRAGPVDEALADLENSELQFEATTTPESTINSENEEERLEQLKKNLARVKELANDRDGTAAPSAPAADDQTTVEDDNKGNGDQSKPEALILLHFHFKAKLCMSC